VAVHQAIILLFGHEAGGDADDGFSGHKAAPFRVPNGPNCIEPKYRFVSIRPRRGWCDWLEI
jgi:hypothetical protein